MKIIASQIGSRFGYLIPQFLEEAGMLYRFYTDTCNHSFVGKFANKISTKHPKIKKITTEFEQCLEQGLQSCRSLDRVADVRCLGAIGVVELHKPVSLASMQERFVDRGVWVRPFGTLVYVMPPYCIAAADLDHLCRAVVEVVALEN